mmetsp:Transcript_17016/g.36680  ORF Transcript_17016/g.36680 Transcript_17016/m.36680 type:complete len:490 (-) Transcript_17016:10-1479(-)
MLRQCPTKLALKPRSIRLVAESRIGVQSPRGNLGQIRQRRHVNVRAREEEHVHADLRPAELHRRVLVPSRRRTEQLDLVRSAHDLNILAWCQRAIAERGQYALENAHFASNVFGHCERRLERRSEACILAPGIFKHARQIFEKDVNNIPTLLQIDQQIIRSGDEQFHQIRHHQHLRTAQSTLETVIMHRIIIRQKSNLRPGTPRQRIQTSANPRSYTLQHATRHTRSTNINHKEITGRLGRTDHVLRGGNVLHDSLGEFRTGAAIASSAVFVEVAEVGCGDFVESGANVAAPSTAVFEEGDEGIDVSPAAFTPHNPRSPRLHHLDLIIIPHSTRSHRTNHRPQRHLALMPQIRRSGNIFRSELKNARRDLDGMVDILLKDILGWSSRNAGGGAWWSHVWLLLLLLCWCTGLAVESPARLLLLLLLGSRVEPSTGLLECARRLLWGHVGSGVESGGGRWCHGRGWCTAGAGGEHALAGSGGGGWVGRGVF